MLSNWTTEKPTKEGWYWVCAAIPTLVQITRDAIGDLVINRVGDEQSLPLCYAEGRWLGPVTPGQALLWDEMAELMRAEPETDDEIHAWMDAHAKLLARIEEADRG